MPWAVSQVGAGELGVVAAATASSSIYIMVELKVRQFKRGADHKSVVGLARSAAFTGTAKTPVGYYVT